MNVLINKQLNYDLNELISCFRQFFAELDLWNKLTECKTVLLKPNLLGPYSPDEAVTTHPVVLEAIIILLQEQNKEVWLGDGPGGSVVVKETWEKTGIFQLARKYDLRLLNFSEGGVDNYSANTLSFGLTNYINKADAVINVAKYKTHSLMYYTGAVKNLYGLIPGLKKSDYHRDHADYEAFSKVISSLYSLVSSKITLNILDGIMGMEGDGPSAGIKRNFGIMMASESAAALDLVAAGMMGFNHKQLLYVIDSLKTDNLTPDQIQLSKEWKKFKFHNVKHKKISLFIKLLSVSPGFLKKLFKKWYNYTPEFDDKCRFCMVCLESCPVKAISLDDKIPKMTIDQNVCIKCMCCHEFCPYHAVYIKKSWLARRIIK